MKRSLFIFSLLLAWALASKAQDTVKSADAPLIISGSVDTYFKYDFSKHGNIPTSFASDQNSISIGMVDLALRKKVSKVSFVGELSFGPRSDQSIPSTGLNNQSFHIQNLYVGYDITGKLNVTAGYMATFVGYEVISPTGNFNYSTSYLFTNGPFQNAGVKLTYAFTDKVSLMAGIFNDVWNAYTSNGKINTFGVQLLTAPVKGLTVYVNLLTGPQSGTEIDLTTAYQITSAFKLGLNAADFTAPKPNDGNRGGFDGIALYPQLAVSPVVTLGLRGEYFRTKQGVYTSEFAPTMGNSVTGLTATANIKSGPLTLIPEIRLDNMQAKDFFKGTDGEFVRSASQFSLAAVYAF